MEEHDRPDRDQNDRRHRDAPEPVADAIDATRPFIFRRHRIGNAPAQPIPINCRQRHLAFHCRLQLSIILKQRASFRIRSKDRLQRSHFRRRQRAVGVLADLKLELLAVHYRCSFNSSLSFFRP